MLDLPPTQDSSHHQKNIIRLWKLNLYLWLIHMLLKQNKYIPNNDLL